MSAGNLKIAGIRLVVEGATEFQKEVDRTEQALKENRAQLQLLDAQYGKHDNSLEKATAQEKLYAEQLELQKKRLQQIKAAQERYASNERANQKDMDKATLAVMKQEARVQGLTRELNENRVSIEQRRQALEQAARQEALASKEAAEAAEAQVRMKRESVMANREIDYQGQAAQRTAAQLEAWGNKAVKTGARISQAGAKMTKGTMLTVGAGLTYSAKEAIAFEDAFASVIKTVDGSKAELERLKDGAMALSASGAITQSKEEVAQIMAVAGQLAISTDHIMGFSKAMLQMGDATNLGAEEAATQLAQFANITQMSQDNFENLGSAIVALGNNTATQEDAIVAMGMRIAAAGNQADMSVASIMGISAALSSVGVEAEAGGTAISKVLINMDTAAAKGEKALKEYAQVAGMSAKEFKGLWDTSSEQAFTAFIQGLSRIDKEGGNVAATLEAMGYKEVRTRDALMRAAMAGDLLGDAIGLANTAFKENTALASEAAKKNDTLAARLKVLGNRVDNAAMGFGEAMMPMMEDALDTVSALVQQFGALDEEQRQTIVSLGLTALAAGPVTSALGTMTQGVGYALKGFKLLKAFLSGPTGWMGLVAVGLAGICAALANVETPLEQVEKRLKNVEFTVDDDLAATINGGIQAGIDAAQKEWTVTVAVQTQMDELGAGLDNALSDGDLSKKEVKSLKKQLNTLIKADIDEAKKELDASVKAYVDTLSGLKTATGEDLFTAEEKAKIISDIEGKTSSLIAELETYQQEYNTLLDVIYKQNEPVTAQQMAELDALMAKIQQTREQIKLATDEAVQAARAQYDLTVGGRGNEKTSGAAIGYVQGAYNQAAQEAETAYTKALAATQAIEDETVRTLKQEEALHAYEEAMAQAGQTAQAGYEAILGGEARRMGVDDELARLNQLSEGITLLEAAAAHMADGTTVEGMQAVMQSLFADGSVLSGTLEGMNAWDKAMVQKWLELDPALLDEVDLGTLSGVFSNLMTRMMEEAAGIAESSEMDPLTTLFQTMFNAGAFDPETLDLTQVDGALAGVMNLLDFTGKGEQFGYDFAGGIGGAMERSQETVRTAAEGLKGAIGSGLDGLGSVGTQAADDVANGIVKEAARKKSAVYAAGAALGAAFAAGVNSKKGIDAGSPSKKARQSARWVAEGLTDEMEVMRRSVKIAGERLGAMTLEGIDSKVNQMTDGHYTVETGLDTPIAGSLAAIERYAASAGSVTRETVQNDNSTLNFSVGKLVVREEADARNVATEVSNLWRRKNAGYGG